MSDVNIDPMLESDHWCITDSDVAVTTFTWKIKNFASLPEETGEAIYSSTFSAKNPNDENSTKWKLKLFPNGDAAPGNYLEIFLTSLNDISVKAEYQVSILD